MPKEAIAVICGAGIATSTVVAKKIEKLCQENNLDIKINKGLASEADYLTRDAFLIVATTKLPKDYGIPVIKGTPLISGIGEKDTLQQILEAIQSRFLK